MRDWNLACVFGVCCLSALGATGCGSNANQSDTAIPLREASASGGFDSSGVPFGIDAAGAVAGTGGALSNGTSAGSGGQRGGEGATGGVNTNVDAPSAGAGGTEPPSNTQAGSGGQTPAQGGAGGSGVGLGETGGIPRVGSGGASGQTGTAGGADAGRGGAGGRESSSSGGSAGQGTGTASATTATGGVSRTGGFASGGSSGTGGIVATGGSIGTGGIAATGGVSGTGGIVATGGVIGTGGIVATGGVSGTGGIVTSGGVSGTGGHTTGTGGGTGGVGGQHAAIVVNHTTVDASVIPLASLDKARAFDVVFQHKSVGTDITNGLKTLATKDASRYTVNIVGWPYWWTDDTGGHDGVPPSVAWYGTHNGIGNWENGTSGEAATKTRAFDELIRSGYGDVVRVALMKFCFTETWSGTGQETWDLYRPVMTGLMRDYPNVTFIWATMPIAFMAHQDDSNNYGRPTYEFNNLLRAHVAAHGGYLFDVADMESYGRDGQACTDSVGYPALCPEWAVAANDTHLGSAGAERAANAWWYLMARVAGWTP